MKPTLILRQSALALYWIYLLELTDRRTLCRKLGTGQRQCHLIMYYLSELELIHIGYYKAWKHQYVLTEKGKIVAEKIVTVYNGLKE